MNNLFNLNSNLFKGAKEGKPSGIIFTLLSPILIMFIALIPVNMLIQLIYIYSSNISFLQNYMPPISLIINTGSGILICFAIVKFKEKRNICTMGFCLNKKAIFDYLEGFGIGIIMITIVWIFIILFGNATFKITTDNLISNGFVLPFIFMLIGWIIQGAEEEILMRGYMMPVLNVKLGPKFAVIISSCFFSGLHLLNNGITLLSLINLALFGFFAAFYSIKNENLWGVCAIHSAWNFAQQNIFGTLVSGGSLITNSSLIETKVLENNFINGGSFGPEGGILVTIVLILGILLIKFTKKA